MTSLVCSRALKGPEIQTTVKSPFSNLQSYNLQTRLTREIVLASDGITIKVIDFSSIYDVISPHVLFFKFFFINNYSRQTELHTDRHAARESG